MNTKLNNQIARCSLSIIQKKISTGEIARDLGRVGIGELRNGTINERSIIVLKQKNREMVNDQQ